jgi:OCT family organic cation transporter-like MFS transporter 4/5
MTSGQWRSRSGHYFGELPWQLGHLSLGLLVYLLPNMKNLELFIGLSAVPFMALWFILPESPRWLLSKGRTEEAKKVLAVACKWNKKSLTPLDHIEDFQLEDKLIQRGTFSDLFKYPSTRRNAICVTIAWLAFSMGYFGLIYNTPAFNWNIYLVFVFPTFCTIPISVTQPIFENRLGRKPILTFALLGAGILLLLTIVVPKGVTVIVLAWIGTIFCSIAFGGGYTYTKELFPTQLRTTALGTASAGARIGSLSSPFIAMLDSTSPVLPLAIYGIIVLTAGIVSLWLWPETNKSKFPETLEEAEKVASTPNPWVKCCHSCC